MALDDLELDLDFPTLLVAAYWTERHCVVPDGFERGRPFGLVWWQAWCLLNFYRLRPNAQRGQLATAFHNRRSQIVLPQKAGKAPYTAAHVCLESVGPALFAGWARGGERWDCREHGCGCGWVYEYQPGEAMGQRWPTPLIQITAFSEKQTDNIYSALRPMIDEGPLRALIPKTGEVFIRLPDNGRIDVVTSEARSRLGARVTYVPQDETGIWTAGAKMIDVAETQRRGLAGMGGRAEETTNGWDPTAGSVAQRTADAAEKTGDIFRWHPQAPKGLSYKSKAERRKIHRVVYEHCRWIDLDGIEAEAAELLIEDPAQAERFFGNRCVSGGGAAFDIDLFKSLKAPFRVPRGAVIVIGVDGARFQDALAIIATDVKTGFQWPLDIIERPDDAPDDYEHDVRRADGAMVDAFERFMVWRVYIDDQRIEHLVEKWTNRWGSERIVTWHTYRPRPIAWAVRHFEQAMASSDPKARLSHDGDPTFATHIANSRKLMLTVKDDKEREMHTLSKDAVRSPRKIDAAMAAVLSWQARGDALEKRVVSLDGPPREQPQPEPRRPRWDGATAPAIGSTPGEQMPAGFMG